VLCHVDDGLLTMIVQPRFNVLLTSVGRRVSLVRFFKESLGSRGYVFAADCDSTAPGLYFADRGFLLPKVTDRNYVPVLMERCKELGIKLVVPLIDPELPVLAKAKDLFIQEGIIPLVSDYEVVMITYDKLQTAKFFDEYRIPAPRVFSLEDSGSLPEDSFPLIIKPRFGSASVGVQRCDTWEDVRFYSKKVNQPILQEFLEGEEVTIDVLCDFEGRILSTAQRKRLKVRAGEVERGITIKDELLFYFTSLIVEALRPFGAINIQCFLTPKGPFFTEINPRFGGGYPLSYYAGANFPRLIVKMLEGDLKGKGLEGFSAEYRENLVMLRYDEAVYIDKSELLD